MHIYQEKMFSELEDIDNHFTVILAGPLWLFYMGPDISIIHYRVIKWYM